MNVAQLLGLDPKTVASVGETLTEWIAVIKAHTEALKQNTLVNQALAEAIIKSGEEDRAKLAVTVPGAEHHLKDDTGKGIVITPENNGNG